MARETIGMMSRSILADDGCQKKQELTLVQLDHMDFLCPLTFPGNEMIKK